MYKLKHLKLLPVNQPAKYFWKVLTGLLLLVTYTNNTSAQPANEKHSLRILWDNDFINLRGDGTDRYYTNGLRIDYFYTKRQKEKISIITLTEYF